ncbi:MAG: ATP-binding protein [Verrucomicrobiales bacterium]
MNDLLRLSLKTLRLSGLLESLEVRILEASSHGLNHGEFVELILQDELAVRSNRQLERMVKAALFRDLKPLDHFDWQFTPSIRKMQILDLAACRFIREKRDVLWLGPPDVGKSFLVQAIGYQAIKAGYGVCIGLCSMWYGTSFTMRLYRRRGQGPIPLPQTGSADHRRHGDEAVAQKIGRIHLRDHYTTLMRRDRP